MRLLQTVMAINSHYHCCWHGNEFPFAVLCQWHTGSIYAKKYLLILHEFSVVWSGVECKEKCIVDLWL